jgi:aminoglycoside phosphotransferase (APT) family kinase protein
MAAVMVFPNEMSGLFDPVTEDAIRDLARAAFGAGAEPVRIDPLHRGLFNTSYYVETRNPRVRAILRIAPAKRELLLEYEKSMMAAEPAIYDMMRRAGAPVPPVLWIDTSHIRLSRDCMFMEWVDAVPLDHASVPAEAKPGLMQELGEYAKCIHSVKGERFGWPAPDGGARGSIRWADVLGGLIRELCDKSHERGMVSETEAIRIQDLWRGHEHFFLDIQSPRLVHNDLWEANVLVAPYGRGWHIAALIDGDRAMFADREYEWNLWWWNDTAFIRGYGTPLDPSPEAAARRKWYKLILLLFCAYQWKIQFLMDEKSRSFQTKAGSMLQEIAQLG